jgi:predicted dehydrogenase
VIESGKLGRIILIKIQDHSFKRRWDWQTLKKFGGGELKNMGPHYIDQALQLLGSNEPEIFCDLQKTLTLGDAEDHVKIVLKHPDCPVIDIEITNACAYPMKKWSIMGTQGGLMGNTSSIRWKYFDMKSLPHRKVDENPTPDRSFNREEISWKEEVWHKSKRSPLISKIFRNESDPREDGSFNYYEELHRTLCEDAPLAITPESVRRVMWVIEKCFTIKEKGG